MTAKRAGQCSAPGCTKPIEVRVHMVLESEVEAFDEDDEPVEEVTKAFSEGVKGFTAPPEPEPAKKPFKPAWDLLEGRPSPFAGDYTKPKWFDHDVCKDHVEFYKDPWEAKGGTVTLTPVKPPYFPKGHYVRPKRIWPSGRVEASHSVGYGLFVECETISPETWQGRKVTLFLDEADIVEMMKESKEAAIRTRSQPAKTQ